MYIGENLTNDPDVSVEGSDFAFCMSANTGVAMEEAMAGPDAER